MKKTILIGMVMAAAGSFAAPTLTSVLMTQPRYGVVNVTYTLGGEDAIVTADFLTNGVSIGEANFTHLQGDVNCKVLAGNRAFVWKARKDWPDRKVKMTVKLRAWTLANPPDYMVVDLDGTTRGAVKYYVSTNALPEGGLANDVYRLTKMVFRKIPVRNKIWTMGASMGDKQVNELPHSVVLSKDYYMAIYPLTQKQYMATLQTSTNPARFKREQYGSDDYLMGPLETVKFDVLRGGDPQNSGEPSSDSVAGTLRMITGGLKFDLPTEARWEYACGGGSGLSRPWGNSNDSALLKTRMNYNRNVPNEKPNDGTFDYRTTRVDAYPPNNEWGLYDMLGNIEEVCLDWYGDPTDDSKQASPVIDPTGAPTGDTHVTKGGNCFQPASYGRTAWRNAGLGKDAYRGVAGGRFCCEIP